mmetsp:Transcript_88531/g.236584  ORF Transcript_88531/g.236584 Transcript_88531/m.236584 type:complete len:99 (-) Transcript_88531:6-302(-)
MSLLYMTLAYQPWPVVFFQSFERASVSSLCVCFVLFSFTQHGHCRGGIVAPSTLHTSCCMLVLVLFRHHWSKVIFPLREQFEVPEAKIALNVARLLKP